MKHYILQFSIDRKGKVTKLKDVTFDSSQFDVNFNESKQHVLDSEIANIVDNVVASHVNNKLDFVGQNLHSMFDDRFGPIESHLGMKSIGSDKNASASNADKRMDGLASDKITTNNALVTNSANQHSDIYKLRLFPLSLPSPAFTWFISLPPNSVHTWADLEQKFMIISLMVKLN